MARQIAVLVYMLIAHFVANLCAHFTVVILSGDEY